MKPRLRFTTAFVAAAQACAWAQAPAAAPPDAGRAVFLDPDTPQFAEVRELGERAINRAGYALVAEVTNAIARSGTMDALKVCHLKNFPAKNPLPDLPRVTAIKRTSLRLRDPANAPDAADRAALENVQSTLESGDPTPSVLLQRVWLPDGRTEWRVYRPIAVTARCTACHGPRDDMLPALRDELARLYPDDQAANYKNGEWRGLIRVSISDQIPAAH
ncbi:MAG TPA: DUF3365 domain-containing protein [Opitutus sp.]|nr:DUF3365 domain-containing protein [Opitutus sp.]